MSTLEYLTDKGTIEHGVALGPLTTYKSGGLARYFTRPETEDDLRDVAKFVAESGVDVLTIGRGSNLLVADSGFDGLVIHIAKGFNDATYEGLEASAGAGTPLPVLARGSVGAGIAGLEFFVGVPGSVGGAIRQNAGCFGVETVDRLVETRIFDLTSGETFSTSGPDLEMSYRHSTVRSQWVVVSARFRGTSSDTSQSGDLLREITRWRKENQPGGTLNAGSVFKNPEGTSAGFLIEKAGLKGFSVGGVAVSSKHANFIVASPTATSVEIRHLIFEVQRLVLEREQVVLEPEIEMVGFDDDH